jgi:glycosyltransferase involved in cell wall biosynthesis
MTISFAICVHNEHEEIDRLLNQLVKYKKDTDEILVQCDQGNTTGNVYKVLDKYKNEIRVIEFPLNRDFASFKNNLKDNCKGDWVFQIDADEVPDEYLIDTIHYFLRENPETEVFWVPRINTVDGITQEHMQKWGWIKDTQGRINFPDYQCRILQNTPKIKWASKVHEVLVGHNTQSQLPANPEFCLIHPKTIDRQEHQNNFYSTI